VDLVGVGVPGVGLVWNGSLAAVHGLRGD